MDNSLLSPLDPDFSKAPDAEYLARVVEHAECLVLYGAFGPRARLRDLAPGEICRLKVLPEFFRALRSGEKAFEVRSTKDRRFCEGMLLELCEFDGEAFTGRTLYRVVGKIFDLSSCPGLEGFAAFNVEKLYIYDSFR